MSLEKDQQTTYLNKSIGGDIVILQRRHSSDSIRVSPSSKLQTPAQMVAGAMDGWMGGCVCGYNNAVSIALVIFDSFMNANRTQTQQGMEQERRNAIISN